MQAQTIYEKRLLSYIVYVNRHWAIDEVFYPYEIMDVVNFLYPNLSYFASNRAPISFQLQSLSEISVRISNKMCCFLWNVIAYPYLDIKLAYITGYNMMGILTRTRLGQLYDCPVPEYKSWRLWVKWGDNKSPQNTK